jgi:hypothetical protein
MRLLRSRFWARAVAVLSLGLTILLAAPGRADDHHLSATAPGTHRVIQIGPQEWVSVDEHGKVSPAEEPPEAVSNPKATLTAVVSVLGAAFIGLLAAQNGVFFDRNGPDRH